MQQQFALDRETKMERLEPETMSRVEVLNAQKRNEDLRTLAMDTSNMHPADATIIGELIK